MPRPRGRTAVYRCWSGTNKFESHLDSVIGSSDFQLYFSCLIYERDTAMDAPLDNILESMSTLGLLSEWMFDPNPLRRFWPALICGLFPCDGIDRRTVNIFQIRLVGPHKHAVHAVNTYDRWMEVVCHRIRWTVLWYPVQSYFYHNLLSTSREAPIPETCWTGKFWGEDPRSSHFDSSTLYSVLILHHSTYCNSAGIKTTTETLCYRINLEIRPWSLS